MGPDTRSFESDPPEVIYVENYHAVLEIEAFRGRVVPKFITKYLMVFIIIKTI